MYLKTIAELAPRAGPVPVTGVAERLGISTVSASEMIRRLQERHLVQHTPYKGVRLTEEGSLRARRVIRRHRLWERFLIDALGLSWGKAHSFACSLEHATDDEVADALAAYLDHPKTCPHGNPIPDRDGAMAAIEGQPLSKLGEGDRGRISCLQDASAEVLAFLQAEHIAPGRPVEVLGIAPLDGPRTIRVDGQKRVVGREMAEHIYIACDEGSQ